MSQTLPKLNIKGLSWEAGGEVWDFEQARYLPFGENVVVTAKAGWWNPTKTSWP
jgi:hypothetical protein